MSVLTVNHLSKRFGGVNAIDDLSFEVTQNIVHAIIGPNGAGKTTLLNLISGVYSPSAGDIQLFGESVVGEAPEELARRGASRTFQNVQLCMNMTAIENVMVGAHIELNSSLLAGVLRLPKLRKADAACREKAAQLMEFVGVGQYRRADTDQLPYGALKRLEIARALASKPKLLLLDEPAAGLNHTETGEIAALIRKVVDAGLTVLLVEHKMKLIMNVSDRILVLNYGRKLAEGAVAEVRSNPEVIAAYLGPST